MRALTLGPVAARHAERPLGVIEALDAEIVEVECEVRRFARSDARTVALQTLYGIGPIIACTLLAEIGDAARFRRSAQVVRLAGLDPVVGESADTRRRGHLAEAGSPHRRRALVEAAMRAGRPSHIDHELLLQVSRRADRTRARLGVARKIGRRAFHVLREAEPARAARPAVNGQARGGEPPPTPERHIARSRSGTSRRRIHRPWASCAPAGRAEIGMAPTDNP